MFNLNLIQAALRNFHIDGWLLCDFRGNNPLARRVLDFENRPAGSRRIFYFIPAYGVPRKLVHTLEPRALDHLPGEKHSYVRTEEMEVGIGKLISGSPCVAMEYSPRNAVPTISRVDAGTVELVRSCGAEVVSSGDLVQLFEATWSDEQWAMHLEAENATKSAFEVAWDLIAKRVRAGVRVTEVQVQSAIMDHLHSRGLTASHPATVAAGVHSNDPHYHPGPETDTVIDAGSFVLIDLWGKVNRPQAVYSDLTCVGFVGDSVPPQYQRVFQVVVRARDAAIDLIRDAFESGRPLKGWEVDTAARDVVVAAGYGDNFIHRTGHSIGEELHGNGANMDAFETHEERLVLRRTGFSIEPGIYLSDFGVRSEVNVFLDGDAQIHVTGIPQTEILPVLRAR